MAKEILVKYGVKTEIAKRIGCNRTSVVLALKGLDDTDLYRRIREMAKKEFGGK